MDERGRNDHGTASAHALIQQLTAMAHTVLTAFGADCVLVYQYAAEQDVFAVPPIIAGTLYDHAQTHVSGPDEWVLNTIKDATSWMVDDARFLAVESARPVNAATPPPFVEREGIRSHAGFTLQDERERLGVVIIYYRSPHSFSSYDHARMSVLSSVGAALIKVSRSNQRQTNDSERREAARNWATMLLNEGTLFKADAEQNILDRVLHQALRLIDAAGGAVMWRSASDALTARSTYGISRLDLPIRQSINEGLIGWVARSGMSRIVPDTTLEPDLVREFAAATPSETPSQLLVPLRLDAEVLGVLSLEDARKDHFTQADLYVLETLAASAGLAINVVRRRDRIVPNQAALERRIFDLALALSDRLSWELLGLLHFHGGVSIDVAIRRSSEHSQAFQRICQLSLLGFIRWLDGHLILTPEGTALLKAFGFDSTDEQ